MINRRCSEGRFQKTIKNNTRSNNGGVQVKVSRKTRETCVTRCEQIKLLLSSNQYSPDLIVSVIKKLFKLCA